MADEPADRTLLFLRHAEAAPTPAGGRDRDRQLTPNGAQQAAAIGARLAERPPVEHVLCSTARRTRETLDRLRLRGEPEIEFTDALYDAGGDDIATMIAGLPPQRRVVLIVGHAPGLPAAVYDLADRSGSSPEASAVIENRFPPATCAVIEAHGGWPELTGTRLVDVLLPH